MKLFSIIIPVYNVEVYLPQCLDSILKYRTPEMEIILVDDGSFDSSAAICNDYQARYSEIRVIHQENQGSSGARNSGIRMASGKYLLFVDSDDFFMNNNDFSNCVNYFREHDSDVIIYKNYYFLESSLTFIKNISPSIDENNGQTTKNECLLKLLKTGYFPEAAWLVAIKRSIVIRENLFFIRGIVAEDYDWLCKIMQYAQSVRVLDCYFYVYRKFRAGSVTATGGDRSVSSIFYIAEVWQKKMEKMSLNERSVVAQIVGRALITTFCHYSRCSREIQKKMEIDLKNYSAMMRQVKIPRYWLIFRLYRLFGIRRLSYFIKAGQQLRNLLVYDKKK